MPTIYLENERVGVHVESLNGTSNDAESDYSNASEAAEEVKLQESFGLTPAELADCVMSAQNAPAPQEPKQVERLLRQIKQLWEEQAKPEALKLWFRRPIPAFQGKTPFEMVKEGKAERVRNVLGRLREDVYS